MSTVTMLFILCFDESGLKHYKVLKKTVNKNVVVVYILYA